MTIFDKYKDIFGKPGEGAHAIRIPIINLAAVDVIGTILIAYILWLVIPQKKISFLVMLLIVFAIAEIMHILFGVKTKFLESVHIM